MTDKSSSSYQNIINNEISDDLTCSFKQELSAFKRVYREECAATVLQEFQHDSGFVQ